MLFLNGLLCNGLQMRITTHALRILAKRVFEGGSGLHGVAYPMEGLELGEF